AVRRHGPLALRRHEGHEGHGFLGCVRREDAPHLVPPRRPEGGQGPGVERSRKPAPGKQRYPVAAEVRRGAGRLPPWPVRAYQVRALGVRHHAARRTREVARRPETLGDLDLALNLITTHQSDTMKRQILFPALAGLLTLTLCHADEPKSFVEPGAKVKK